MRLIMNTDGGARGNPGPAASAFVVWDEAGNLQFKCGKYLGETTNNVAEYSGVIAALSWADLNRKNLMEVEKIDFFLDSNLVVNQLNGSFKIKNAELAKLASQIKEIEKRLEFEISYTYVPRARNKEADLIVNETLDSFTN